jgi:uncharacterized membrane protein
MSKPSDHDLDISIAIMLGVGVSLAAAVVFTGGILLFLHPAAPPGTFTHFHPASPGLRTLGGILQGAIRFEPASVVQLGLLVLIATPVARVFFCVVGFARQRDQLYVAISSTVLLILLYSLSYGAR